LSVSVVIVCPSGTDPAAQTRAALEVGAWSRVGADTWALIVDDDEAVRRARGRERQRRYRDTHRSGVTSRHEDEDPGRHIPSRNGDAMSHGDPENPWSDPARHQGVTGEPPLGGFPPVTDPLGDAGVTGATDGAGDALSPRHTTAARDNVTRHYWERTDDAGPLDDLERAKAQRGLASMRAALPDRNRE
jgi:hypothetical protein